MAKNKSVALKKREKVLNHDHQIIEMKNRKILVIIIWRTKTKLGRASGELMWYYLGMLTTKSASLLASH